MKHFKCLLLFAAILLNSTYCSAQQYSLSDSLNKYLKSLNHDTARADALNKLAWSLVNTNPDSFIVYNREAIKLSESSNWKKGMSFGYSCLGIYYNTKGDFSKALTQHFKALKIREEFKDSNSIANTLGNIGLAYWNLKKIEKALSYYNRSISIARRIGNNSIISNQLCNIGLILWKNKADTTTALDYFNQSMQIAIEQGNIILKEINLGNIGNIYSDFAISSTGKKRADYITKSLDYYTQALTISDETKDTYRSSVWSGNMGNLYMDTKEYKIAEQFLYSALIKADSVGDVNGQQQWNLQLSRLYEKMQQPEKAYNYYLAHLTARDSIFNEQAALEEISTEMNYDFEKKEASAKAEQQKKELLYLTEKVEQRKILYFSLAILLLVILFIVFIFKAWLKKKKANTKLFIQKEEIEKKQKEILDSIYYARRIQQSLLPTEKYLEKQLKRTSGK